MKSIGVVAGCILLSSCSIPPQSAPSDRDLYFAKAGVAGEILQLKADGSFSIYSMDCFGGHDERFSGSWKLGAEDSLELTCPDWFRGVACGVVQITLGPEWKERLEFVRKE